jgi:prolyl-tRNA synthetase
MFDAYTRIFTRMGLTFRCVQADSGAIGGKTSHEFQVLADSGEDAIAFSDGDDYAANLETAVALPPSQPRAPGTESLTRVATPAVHTISDLAHFLKIEPTRLLKTLVVEGDDNTLVALALRGDHELNALKAQMLPGVANPLRMASAERIVQLTATAPGSIGPVGWRHRLYADHSALALSDFVCGANEKDAHFTGVNWERDAAGAVAADIRNVVAGDPSPSGRGELKIVRGIEVGHIFKLDQLYSVALKATVLDEGGRSVAPYMGCYGIGVTRVVAAAIEQNHDERGIIWPEPLAPFQVVLVALNPHKSARVRNISERLYSELVAEGVEVLYDDRDARPGVKFADAELWGIPHRVVVGERGVEAARLEYRGRRDSESEEFALDDALAFIRSRLRR